MTISYFFSIFFWLNKLDWHVYYRFQSFIPHRNGQIHPFWAIFYAPHIPKDRKCYTMLIQSCKYAIFYAWKRPLLFSAMVHIAYQWKPCESYFPNNLTSFRSNSNSVPILGINKLTSQAFWVLLTNENWPAVFPTISLVQTVHVTKDGCVAGVNNCFQTIILATPRHRIWSLIAYFPEIIDLFC